MCRHCESEGCYHGREDNHRCSCDLTIGISSCAECGCSCEPWWNGLNISIGGTNLLSGPVGDFMSDIRSDPGSSFFPATKAKILQSLSEAYGMQSGSDQARFIDQNLSSAQFEKPDDFLYALIGHTEPISNNAMDKALVWKYPASKIAPGQKLVVGEGQEVIMVTRNGNDACDSFGPGNYVLTSGNCAILASKSRQTDSSSGIPKLVDGIPVFLHPSLEFETDISVMGQTKALRRILAKGAARFHVSNPKIFTEQIASKGGFAQDGVLSSLKKRHEDLLKSEIAKHEFDELKNNSPLLEKVIALDAKIIGLDCVNVNFSWIGDVGPGMFDPAAMSRMLDPAKIAQMKQFAESMRSAQLAGIRTPPQYQAQDESSSVGAQGGQAPRINCTSCGAQNTTGSKFCNNCGKPLVQQKKICPKCGAQSDPGIKFCGNCGTKLT